MPRPFFDCFDGSPVHADLSGIELADKGEAAAHGACLARSLLNEMADSVGAQAVTTTVRSAEGAQVHAVHLTFQGLQMPSGDQRGLIRMPHPAAWSRKSTPASS